MTLNRFVFKTHKWLAVGIGVLTLAWFLSGIVMVLPQNVMGRRTPSAKPAADPDYKTIAVSIPQAIGALETSLGRPVQMTGVELRRIEGRFVYLITTAKADTHLIDAMDASHLEITEEFAKRIAQRVAGENAALRDAALLRDYTYDYTYGALPAYRFRFADADATYVYVGQQGGDARASNRMGRVREFISGTHTFIAFKPLMNYKVQKVLLMFLSFVGAVMTLFGFWILWIQWVLWWRAHTRAANG